MTYESPHPSVEIASENIASHVLAGVDDDKVVLVDGPSGREYTGAAFNGAVKGLAAGLAARGIGRGDVVALYLPNLPEYAIAFHGVCAAGATNTTANPLYTARELAHQLTRLRCQAPDHGPAVPRDRAARPRPRPASRTSSWSARPRAPRRSRS